MVEPMELKETVYMMKSLNMHLRLERYPYPLIQRKFKIGYNRAARIMDLLEEDGLVASSRSWETQKVF